jgi:glutamate-1-semialdehyde 2,1-aminomutase
MATMTQTETDHPVAGQTTSSLEEALTAAKERYSSRNPKSKAAHEHACQFLPGGNTRTALHTAPFPLCMKSGKDYQVTDEDGHTYAFHASNLHRSPPLKPVLTPFPDIPIS